MTPRHRVPALLGTPVALAVVLGLAAVVPGTSTAQASTAQASTAQTSTAHGEGIDSRDAGRKRAVRIARSRGAVVTPAFDVNRRGVGFAVWVDEDNGRYTIEAARRTSRGRWSEPQQVSRTFPWAGRQKWAWGGRPDVAVDQRGTATVVWSEPSGGQTRIRTATYAGKKGWSRPRYVSAKGDPASFPDVEVSADGHAVLLWSGSYPSATGDFTLLTSYRTPRGRWEPPQRLGTDPAWRLASRPASPAIDDRGVATLTWDEEHRTELGTGRVQLATRGADSGWVPQTMYSGANHGHGPRVATTPLGQLTFAWKTYDAVLAQHRSPTGAWGSVETVFTQPGLLPNLLGLGIADGGLSAVYVQTVQATGFQVQPLVLVQAAPGAAWSPEAAAEPSLQYYAPAYFESFEVGPLGDVSLTWMTQHPEPELWYDTDFRHRLPDGRWLPPVRVGRFAADPDLAADGRANVGVVYGEGRAQHCCNSLEALLHRP